MRHTLKDFSFKGKRVLVRGDFNVPLDKKGRITDDSRIKASLPTIKYLLKRNAKVILMSHLGRPDGKVVKRLRMDAVSKRLSKLLKKNVVKLNDCIGLKVIESINKMKNSEGILLENLRFHKEEEKNDVRFSRALAELGEVYVNDAFGSSHRAHSSIVGVARYLPSCAGLLMEKEIEMLSFRKVKRPFIAVIGGAKVSDKIKVIGALLKKVDKLLLGGAMVFTFYKSKNLETGDSMVEKDRIILAKRLLKKYKDKIALPCDVVIVKKVNKKAKAKAVWFDSIPKGHVGVDIGRETAREYFRILGGAKTVFWNGPLGIYEIKKFTRGTEEIAKLLSRLKAKVIAGGGDTAAVIERLNLKKKFSHISSGGGAALKFIENPKLPGIKALSG